MQQIPFINFNGTEYSKLNDFSKIAIICSDFYKINKGRIHEEHYQMLRTALKETGVDDNQTINVGDFILSFKE